MLHRHNVILIVVISSSPDTKLNLPVIEIFRKFIYSVEIMALVQDNCKLYLLFVLSSLYVLLEPSLRHLIAN